MVSNLLSLNDGDVAQLCSSVFISCYDDELVCTVVKQQRPMNFRSAFRADPDDLADFVVAVTGLLANETKYPRRGRETGTSR